MVTAPTDRALRISRMKQDTYGHLNEIDRCCRDASTLTLAIFRITNGGKSPESLLAQEFC